MLTWRGALSDELPVDDACCCGDALLLSACWGSLGSSTGSALAAPLLRRVTLGFGGGDCGGGGDDRPDED
jgi:hypothetical protein